MRAPKLGSKKQLVVLCGIAAFACALFLISDIRKVGRSIVFSPLLQTGSAVLPTFRPTAAGPSVVEQQTQAVVNTVEPDVLESKKGPILVVIATYMRSGSSLTGDILQQSDGAFYIFEPLRNLAPSTHRVILLTYMRSGSSLTGDILQQMGQGGTFYNYEPLRLLARASEGNMTLELMNGTIRYPPFDFEYEALGVIRNWFTCDLRKLYMSSMKDGFLMKGLQTKTFLMCYREVQVKTKNTSHALDTCLEMLRQKCLESPVKIIKTIRVSLKALSTLFTEFPDLKIVHLVRDPRGTLYSQSRFGMCSVKRGGHIGCANAYCTRLENDILEEEILLQQYPKRIKTVFYENIAAHPIESSREMYDFVGTTFSKRVEEYVFNITMAGHPNSCNICTTRSNSSEHISTWKTKMPRTFVNVVQERCNYMLKKYQYKLV